MREIGSERHYLCSGTADRQSSGDSLPLLGHYACRSLPPFGLLLALLAALLQTGCEPLADISPISGSFGVETGKASNEMHQVNIVGSLSAGD